MKRALESLTKAEFDSLKASGLLWELYPDASEVWEDNQRGDAMTTGDKGAKQGECQHSRQETISFDTVLLCLDCGKEEVI